MNSTAIKVPLIREKQQFQAAIALTQGILKTGQLHLDKLHPREQFIYQGYQHAPRKESYLLGRFSAKEAIKKLTGISSLKSIWVDTGVFQFPIVKGANLQNIQVSISHCDTIGFSIAFPEAHPMGVDVENINPNKADVVLSQITAKEKGLLKNAGLNKMAIYIAIFSIKEAVSKILKTGMMLDFEFLEIDTIKLEKQVLTCTFTHFGQYKAIAYLKKEYVFAIALPKRTDIQMEQMRQLIKK